MEKLASMEKAPVPGLNGAKGIFFDYNNYVLVTMKDGYWLIDKKTLSDDLISAGKVSLNETVKAQTPPQPQSPPNPSSREELSISTRVQQTQTKTDKQSNTQDSKQLNEMNQEMVKSERSAITDSSQIDPKVLNNWMQTKDDYGSWYFPTNFLSQSRAKDNTRNETISTRIRDSSISDGQLGQNQTSGYQFIIFYRNVLQLTPVGVLTTKIEYLELAERNVFERLNELQERIRLVLVDPLIDEHLRIVNDITRSPNAFTLSVSAGSGAYVLIFGMTGIGYKVTNDSALMFNRKIIAYGESGQQTVVKQNKCELSQSVCVILIIAENEIHLFNIGEQTIRLDGIDFAISDLSNVKFR